jgi:hypothetical protein
MAKPFSNEKAIKQAKEAAGQMQQGAIYGMEAADAANARILAGEAAASNIFNAMGQPGTFEPGSGAGTYGGGETNLFDTSAMPNQTFKQMGSFGGRKQLNIPREGVIDPEGYANATIGSIPFKMRSKMTAEAYQLLNKEGPEWDMLENSTLGQIHEGAALQLRDTIRQLKNNYAKGGTARRTAVNEFGAIQAAERAHQMKANETWQANLRLHDYIRQNADRVQAGNISYVNSLPGLNQAYRESMTKTAALMISAGEKAAIIAGEAYEIRAQQKAVNFGTTLLEAGITMAVSKALDSGPSALAGMGDYIAGWGGTGEDAGIGGQFTDILGGGVRAIGGDVSGLFGQDGAISRHLPQSQYSKDQQAAVAAAQGTDANAEALAAVADPKNTSSRTTVGEAFAKKMGYG